MAVVWASVIAVLGTLGGATASYLFQGKISERNESTARDERLRQERRELYARFQHASAQMWDSLFRVIRAEENGASPPDDAVQAVNDSWIAWAKTWMEMSIVASDEVWRITEPLFEQVRLAYSQRKMPSEDHEDDLREQMRRELGR